MVNKMTETYKLLHITDIHLDHASEITIKKFARKIREVQPSAVIITGDIAEAPSITTHLGHLDLLLENKCPIFFVLGNHDYYHSSIKEVREEMSKLFTYDETSKITQESRLGWLGNSGVIPLTEKTALVGHDGWYDGQYANWFKSRVWLNDYLLIAELGDTVSPLKELKFKKINELSLESAEYVKTQITEAFKTHEQVIVATHVPPFRENAVYNKKISDDDWMPHFSSKHMGDMLLEMASQNKDKYITVLCGHSHGYADFRAMPNLRCYTGQARYGQPCISKIFEVL